MVRKKHWELLRLPVTVEYEGYPRVTLLVMVRIGIRVIGNRVEES